jgi:DNA-binding transcriptional LysR family regulator
MPVYRKDILTQVRDADLRLLRIFRTVVENGGFAAAQVDLNISRPAISVAISDLESRIGLKLAQRGRSGFALTDEGRAVYHASLQLFTSMETFKSQVNALHQHLRGNLNIGITDNLVTMEHMNVSDALTTLKKEGSEVRINIQMAPPGEIERGVIDGQLHVGVVPQFNNIPVLDYVPLYEETSYLYCGHTHPFFKRQPDDESALVAADMVATASAQDQKAKVVEKAFNATASATDREGIAFLILTGAYIGFLPSHFAKRWVKEKRMKSLYPERVTYNTRYAAITRKGARPNLVVETFMQHLNVMSYV